MSNQIFDDWQRIIEDARWYPSPHNSQPIKIKFVSETSAELFYDLDLGLPAENYGKPFGHVCVGVFLESLRVVAAARGFTVHEHIDYSDMDFDASDRLHALGSLKLAPIDITEDSARQLEVFRVRQTSRRPYQNKIVDSTIVQGAVTLAADAGIVFGSSDNSTTVKQVVRVNQATLFDDLRNEPVYQEIMQWLRFSKREARTKADGLSAETMLMPGRILKFAMKHRSVWSTPIIGSCIRGVYLHTMRGVRQIGWLEGSFNTPKDYIEAGRTFMKIWLYFTEQGVCLHPFGTVITNPQSHEKFIASVGITETRTSMAWMLFRFGYSKKPPQSHRRERESMIIKENI